MSDVDTQTIKLSFSRTLRVAGEAIEGEVHLFFPGLMKDKVEEVHVKLRGFVLTKITRQTGQTSTTYRQRVYLAMTNISLWSMGNGVYPPPGTDILKIPFAFTLPSELLPSCDYGSGSKVARVRYFVEVVGKRPGIWRFNERSVAAFPVLPPSASGAQLREMLQREPGWQGAWRTIVEDKDIRRGIWGEHSHVQATLVIPDIDVIPVFARIPFTLTIVTHSKAMKREDKTDDEVIFPAPPLQPREVDFRLESDVWMKAKSWHTTRHDNFVAQLGGLGPRSISSAEPVSVDAPEKSWIPDGEKSEKGRWRQEVAFRSSFQLSCAPTFDSQTMVVSYKMKLKVDFPGIGNSLKMEFPVRIVSSMFAPGEQPWDGPPPEFDLPPDYFQGDWDEDTKDEKE